MWTCPKCGLNLPRVVHPVRCICGYTEFVAQDEVPPPPPAYITWLTRFRKPQDRGPGDTLERLLGVGGWAFKKAWALVGKDCGCASRRDEWNERWGY